MPACADCRKLYGGECQAYQQALQTLGRQLPPPPLGACMIPIVEDYLKMISPAMSVLDVGCGSWAMIRDHCQLVGARYEGIDVSREYFGRHTVATRLENLANLSYEDQQFDLVIGNQTMEHWAENGCSLRWGLYQCFRVCKQGGKVLLNVPIHFHGTRTFMLGDLQRLKAIFQEFSHDVVFHSWGKPADPLPDLYPYPGYRPLRKLPAYVLDIHATRNQLLPQVERSREKMPSGRRAQLRNYPLSYNLYRVLRKLGLFPKGFKQG